MWLEPILSRLVAMRYDDDVTAGGLIVPEQSKKNSLRAVVIETGPDCQLVEPGDKILTGRYAGFDMPLRDRRFAKFFIMNEADILGILHDEENVDNPLWDEVNDQLENRGRIVCPTS